MAAVYRNFWLLLAVFVPLVACSQALPEPPSEGRSVSQLLSKRLAESVSELESAIARCGNMENERDAISLKPAILENAPREQLLVAIGHLHFHNRFECERQARQAAAFDIGTMQSLAASDVSPEELKAINQSLIYPSRQQLEYEIRYLGLPEELRSDLEAAVGHEPFPLMETLEMNNLTERGS